jgi:hypothetical protein
MGLSRLMIRAARWSAEGRDPVNRARVRSQARRLVRKSVSTDGDSEDEVAEVALLRLLDLQTRVRRSARKGEDEGAVLLARCAVEACLVGLYCVYGKDVIDVLNRENTRRIKRMVRYLADSDSFPARMIDAAMAELGPTGSCPPAEGLAKEVVAGGGPELALRLYELVYVPISTMYAHSSGISLARYVDVRSRATRARPWRAWGKRSPSHVADACVGLLGAALADRAGHCPRAFARYTTLHWDRVVIPSAFMMLRVAGGQVEWRALPRSIWLMLALRRWLRTEEVAAMDRGALERDLSTSLGQIWHMCRATPPPQLQQVFVTAIADSVIGIADDVP